MLQDVTIMAPSPEASKATPILPISQETNLNQVLPFNIRDSDGGWEPKLTTVIAMLRNERLGLRAMFPVFSTRGQILHLTLPR